MSTKDPEKLKAKRERYRNALRRERQSWFVALGNKCFFWRQGDCDGPLELDHPFGHADDPFPWRHTKLRLLFIKNKLRILCKRHNIQDGAERKKIINKKKLITRDSRTLRHLRSERDQQNCERSPDIYFSREELAVIYLLVFSFPKDHLQLRRSGLVPTTTPGSEYRSCNFF